ncbi:MAG TPA: winged helix-turn-helix domain-containing protein [Candidatus Angelobacter sp.]|nr:winged helix-turn-helix domain-containing protein [Candidatus Angelobacter sp.]
MDSEFRLGEWLVLPKLNSATLNGKTFHLEPKVMQVLTCLAEAGDIVSKETLMRTVWADTFVTDDVLTRSISELRKVFGDDPKRPQYIQTIPKSGYRLLVPATRESTDRSAATPAPSPSTPSAPSSPRPSPALFRKALVVALLTTGIALATVLVIYFNSRANGIRTVGPAGRNMLAVLPFQNLNNDPEHDYYADGLTAEMISQLGRLPSDRLGVIAWNSMIRYKGTKKSEDEIATELGANYVLEGTVRRSDSHVRITAELVHIGDRSQVWANSYDGNLEDVLSLQNRVAREIASEIQVRLTPEQEARLSNAAPLDPEAYNIYLKGRFSAYAPTEATINKTIEQFQEAIRLNPSYGPAYVQVAVAYRRLASEGFAPSSAYAKAQAALQRALQIDPTMAEAQDEMGWVEWRGNWNFAAAETHFLRARDLAPGDAQPHSEYSLYLKGMGRFQDALAESESVITLNPLDAYGQANAGHLLGLMQRYDEAAPHFRKALELAPNQPYVHERYGAVLLWQGKREQAIAEFERAADLSHGQPEKIAWLAYAYAVSNRRREALSLLALLERAARERKQYVSPLHIALVDAGLGDNEGALRWLAEAYSQHDEWLVYLHVYPEFQNLHSQQRFIDLERRIGLTR